MGGTPSAGRSTRRRPIAPPPPAHPTSPAIAGSRATPSVTAPRTWWPSNPALGVYGSPEHPFLSGRVAMTNQGPWLANRIVEHKNDLDYGVAPFPVAASVYDPARPIGLLDSDVLVIPKGAKHPREAFEFIAYTQRQGSRRRAEPGALQELAAALRLRRVHAEAPAPQHRGARGDRRQRPRVPLPAHARVARVREGVQQRDAAPVASRSDPGDRGWGRSSGWPRRAWMKRPRQRARRERG